jgi:glycosyltransferase involved in cell wall biosynthesis
MKVLYFIDSLVPSGAEKSLLALSPHFLDGGIELEIAYLNDRPGLQKEFEDIGVPTICLDGSGGRLGWGRRARHLAAERRPDLIHTTLFEADLAGRTAASLTRTPVVSSLVSTMYGPEQFGDPNLSAAKLRMAQSVDAATARFVRRWHAISENVADTMARRLIIDRNRIDVIPRGRDPEVLGRRTTERGDRVRQQLGIAADTPLILAAARHEYPKGLTVALEAFSVILERFPDAVFLIAGREGSATPAVRAASERLGLGDRLRLLGARNDVPDLMAAADVCVISSLWEGLGGTAIEAMALETPLVASDLPPIREVVGERVAALVPKSDPGALAVAITTTLENPKESIERTARGYNRFLERFAITTVAEQMLAFYDRAMAQPLGVTPAKPVAMPPAAPAAMRNGNGHSPAPLRLLYIIDSLVAGGAERSLASLAPYYLELGVDLTIGYLRDRPGLPRLQEDLTNAGITVVNLEGGGGRTGNVYRVNRFLKDHKPDLVHTTLFEADLAGRAAAFLSQVPVVSTLPAQMYDWEHVHDPTLSSWRVRAAQAADLTTAQTVRRFHAVSGHVKESMAGRLHVPSNLIDVIPRGRDPQILGERSPERRRATRVGLGFDDSDILVFTAARHEHKKALDVLLRSFEPVVREFPAARVVIAGREGIQTPLLHEVIAELRIGSSVDLLGPRRDVPDLLCAADVFVLSSVSEGFPGAVLEALAMEAPVVATDLPGVREVLGETDPCGRVVPARRPDLLGAAIIETLRDQQTTAELTARGRQRFIEMFSIDRVAERMVEFYREAMSAS